MAKRVALVGDGSSHGGTIITSNQDGRFKTNGIEVAVDGAQHSCPVEGHGITPVSAVTTKSFCNGKLILIEGSVASCGAVLIPEDRNVYVE